MPLTKTDLDKRTCKCCGVPSLEHPLEIISVCHPDIPLKVAYYDGCLAFWCSSCKKPVCIIAVAPGDDLVRPAT